jgi:hypothetical protein
MEERDNEDKLHFIVLGNGTWSVMKCSLRGSQNAKVWNGKMNARVYEVNPMLQMNLNKIRGLLLQFRV